MITTRELYDDYIPDEMVARGKVWYASYRDHLCVITNSDKVSAVSRYDYATPADLESVMRHVRRYGESWVPSQPAPDLRSSNDIIDAFFKAEGAVDRDE